MKKIFPYLIVVIVLSLSYPTKAQNIYLKLQGEYDYGLSQKRSHYLNPIPGMLQDEIAPYTYGNGTNFGLSAGYIFSDKISLELSIFYHLSQKFEFEQLDITHYARTYNINPSVVISPGNEGFNPYARIGLVFGLGKIISEKNEDDFYSKEELTGGLGIGFNTALGAEYGITDKFKLFAELKAQSLSLAPEKAEYVVYEQNGIDYLPNMTTSQKEVDFVEEYDQEYGMDDDDPDEPETRLKYNYSFSNIGINIGLKISF